MGKWPSKHFSRVLKLICSLFYYMVMSIKSITMTETKPYTTAPLYIHVWQEEGVLLLRKFSLSRRNHNHMLKSKWRSKFLIYVYISFHFVSFVCCVVSERAFFFPFAIHCFFFFCFFFFFFSSPISLTRTRGVFLNNFIRKKYTISLVYSFHSTNSTKKKYKISTSSLINSLKMALNCKWYTYFYSHKSHSSNFRFILTLFLHTLYLALSPLLALSFF